MAVYLKRVRTALEYDDYSYCYSSMIYEQPHAPSPLPPEPPRRKPFGEMEEDEHPSRVVEFDIDGEAKDQEDRGEDRPIAEIQI